MKAKFRCPECAPEDLGLGPRNDRYEADDGVPTGGWTTGCCTVQLMTKTLKSSDRSRIELKLIVRAFSQYCKECKTPGDIGTYKDEIERISYVFSQNLVARFFEEYRPRRNRGP